MIFEKPNFSELLFEGLADYNDYINKNSPDTQELTEAYASSLAGLDATDTLVAVAKAP